MSPFPSSLPDLAPISASVLLRTSAGIGMPVRARAKTCSRPEGIWNITAGK